MPRYPRWEEEEVDILHTNYPRLSLNGRTGPVTKKVLLSLLPKKSWDAIRWKARLFHLKRDLRVVYPPIKLPDFDLGYLTGLIDGEGCISFSKHLRKSGITHYYPYVSIANTFLLALKWVEETTEFGRVRRTKQPPPLERTEKGRPQTWSNCYTWQASSYAEIYRIVKDIGPHLKIKERQAELVLEFLEIEAEKPIAKSVRDPDTGYFIRKIPIEHTARQEDIFNKVRALNSP